MINDDRYVYISEELERETFMALDSCGGGETFEDALRSLITERRDDRIELDRLRNQLRRALRQPSEY